MIPEFWYLKLGIQFNSSRQTLNSGALRLWTFQIKWMVGWLTQIIIIISSFYNQMSCLVSVKSLYHECLNIMSSSWLMWLARKAMFTEGWKLQEAKITKTLQKKMTNIAQWLSYFEVTPDIKQDGKSASNISSFCTFSSWSLEQKLLVYPSLDTGPVVLGSTGQLYTGKSLCIWERFSTSFWNIL